MPDLIEDAVVKRFGDVVRASKLSRDKKMTSVMEMVLDRAMAEASKSASFQMVVEPLVQKRVVEPHIVDSVVTRMIDAPALTVPVAKFVKHEVEKGSRKGKHGETHYQVNEEN